MLRLKKEMKADKKVQKENSVDLQTLIRCSSGVSRFGGTKGGDKSRSGAARRLSLAAFARKKSPDSPARVKPHSPSAPKPTSVPDSADDVVDLSTRPPSLSPPEKRRTSGTTVRFSFAATPGAG